MNQFRPGWMRLKTVVRKRRETIVGSAVAIAFVFAIFAFGSTKPAEHTTVTGTVGSERVRTLGEAGTDAESAAGGAQSDAAASAGGGSSPAGAAQGGGGGDLAGGVKPGHGVDNLLKNLGVVKPKHEIGVGGARGPVSVGVDYQDAGAANSFFRQYSVDAGAADPGAQAQAVAAWVNAHGGIGGARLSLKPRHYDFYRDRLSVLDAATCDAYGTGERVIADVDRHASTDILLPCLAKRDVPTLVNAQSSPAKGDFDRFPTHLYATASPAIDRPQQAYVQALKAAGFFPKGKKVGVLRSEGLPQLDHAHDALRGALTDAHVPVALEVPVSTEDVASFLLTETNAMVKMRLAGIDRIVGVDENGVVTGQFMRNAEAQHYRPLYGVNSIASPQFLARETPQRQLRGALGIGWSPLVDVTSGSDPSNPVRDSCDRIFAGAGVAAGDRTPFGQYTAYHICDSILMIAAAVRVSGSTTPIGLRRGLEAVGPKWQSPLAISSRIDGARHDGAATWRVLRFSDGCGCFRYEGPSHGF